MNTNRNKVRILFFLALPFFLYGCGHRMVTVTVSTFSDGNSKQTCYYQVRGNDSSLVKEMFYYQNKNPRLQGEFVRDTVLNGLWTGWYDNGQKLFEAVFADGKRNGNWKIWDFSGKECQDSLFQVKEDTVGLPSLIKFFSVSDNGKELTALVDFYPNHCIKSAGTIKGNKKNGKWTVWYDDGTKWSEGEFKFDVGDGLRTVYYPDGKKYYEGKYLLGEKMGEWTFWNERGDVIRQVTYKH